MFFTWSLSVVKILPLSKCSTESFMSRYTSTPSSSELSSWQKVGTGLPVFTNMPIALSSGQKVFTNVHVYIGSLIASSSGQQLFTTMDVSTGKQLVLPLWQGSKGMSFSTNRRIVLFSRQDVSKRTPVSTGRLMVLSFKQVLTDCGVSFGIQTVSSPRLGVFLWEFTDAAEK